MIESPKKRAVLVGVFVFLGTIFFILGILLIGNLKETFTTKMEIFSLFDDVGGLTKGDNIWFSGVKIGTVSDLEFYKQSQVKVGINIDVNAQKYIKKDATVKISSDGFIGNKIIVISGGSSASPIVNNGDFLEVEPALNTEEMMNTLQANNENLLAITTDFKTLTSKLANGEGSIGKLLHDESLYISLNETTKSLQMATNKANQMIKTLADFASNLNKEGTLVNELATDTVVFNSVKTSLLQLQQIADTASVFIRNLKQASSNPSSSIGVLLHDEESGNSLKETIKNLESSSAKLDEDLEAVQQNFLLRRHFKKKAKKEAKE